MQIVLLMMTTKSKMLVGLSEQILWQDFLLEDSVDESVILAIDIEDLDVHSNHSLVCFPCTTSILVRPVTPVYLTLSTLILAFLQLRHPVLDLVCPFRPGFRFGGLSLMLLTLVR